MIKITSYFIVFYSSTQSHLVSYEKFLISAFQSLLALYLASLRLFDKKWQESEWNISWSAEGNAGVSSGWVVHLHRGFSSCHVLWDGCNLLGWLLSGLSGNFLLDLLALRLVGGLVGLIPGEAEVALASGGVVHFHWGDSLVLLWEFHKYYLKSNAVHTNKLANCQNWISSKQFLNRTKTLYFLALNSIIMFALWLRAFFVRWLDVKDYLSA